MFGAGNVGRGFLGQLFSESGHEVVFVDIDEPLIAAINAQRAYTIRLVDNEYTEEVRVGPVSGLLSQDGRRVAEALTEATLAATAVGARALPHIAPLVAEGIALRARQSVDVPLNIIVCENLKGAAAIFRGLVQERLDATLREYLRTHVGFVDTVIGRMVPELPSELCAQDPTFIIVEPYKELPVDRSGFIGEIPQVVGMEPCGDFALYVARKLYLHNAGHALLGYLGYRRGYELGYNALEDPKIRPILDAALDESIKGIMAQYGAEESWLREHVADLMARFANRALADPILRLARDPLRKLAPSDRLVGAARCAQRASAETAGMVPVNLAWGIAGGLAFDAPQDQMAVELQKRIAAQGIEAVLELVCEIGPNEPLGQAVLERYQRLHRAPWRRQPYRE